MKRETIGNKTGPRAVVEIARCHARFCASSFGGPWFFVPTPEFSVLERWRRRIRKRSIGRFAFQPVFFARPRLGARRRRGLWAIWLEPRHGMLHIAADMKLCLQSSTSWSWAALRRRARFLCLAFALMLPLGAMARGQATVRRETIEAIGRRYGFPPSSMSGGRILLESRYTSMAFEINSRKLFFNEILIWLNGTVATGKGGWTIAAEDTAKVIDPLLRSEDALADAGFSTIVLDPGHGGDDTGAIGRRRVLEKKVSLDIARRVREKLQGSGTRVLMTRQEDVAMSLAERGAKAKKWRADIFVSIHCNAARDGRAEGIETYVMPCAGFSSTSGRMNKQPSAGNSHDRANMILAYHVQKHLLKSTGGVDRGIRRARFDVLSNAPCPAILVECGFVSNKSEEEKMLTRAYRDRVADGIAAGVMEYVNVARSAAAAGARTGGGQ